MYEKITLILIIIIFTYILTDYHLSKRELESCSTEYVMNNITYDLEDIYNEHNNNGEKIGEVCIHCNEIDHHANYDELRNVLDDLNY